MKHSQSWWVTQKLIQTFQRCFGMTLEQGGGFCLQWCEKKGYAAVVDAFWFFSANVAYKMHPPLEEMWWCISFA